MNSDQLNNILLLEYSRQYLDGDYHRRLSLQAAMRQSHCQCYVLNYFRSIEGQTEISHTPDRCKQDLALIAMVAGDGDLDPRDGVWMLDVVMQKSHNIQANTVQECFAFVAKVAEECGASFISKRMAEYPSIYYRNHSAKNTKGQVNI